MATIGEQLKKARLEKGLTLEELQQMTKIQKRYLAAIESNDFDTLPGTYYVRSFIRQFAGAVGVNGDILVQAYDANSKQPEVVRIEEVRGSRTAALHTENKTIKAVKSKIPLIILSIVALTIIGTVLYFTWKEKNSKPIIDRPEEVVLESRSNTSQSSSTKESTTESTAEKPTTTSSSAEKTMAVNFDGEEGAEIAMSLKDAKGPVTISFEGVDGACWIGVSVDGVSLFDQTTQAGVTAETKLPEGTASARIVLGASKNVKVKVNGQELNFNPNNTSAYQRNVNLTIAYQ